MSNIITKLIDNALRFFQHQESCILCKTFASYAGLCHACQKALPQQALITCHDCALMITTPGLCGRCLRQGFAFDAVYAAHPYSYPISELIQAFKYQKRLNLAKPLAQLMLKNRPPKTDILIPSPLHQHRLKERGFNQSLLLAKYLSHFSQIPLITDAAIKIRDTQKQSLLNEKTRQHNLSGAFYIHPHKVKGLSITVIDDVLTSGTTMHTLAKALKKAGATVVNAWVLARTQEVIA